MFRAAADADASQHHVLRGLLVWLACIQLIVGAPARGVSSRSVADCEASASSCCCTPAPERTADEFERSCCGGPGDLEAPADPGEDCPCEHGPADGHPLERLATLAGSGSFEDVDLQPSLSVAAVPELTPPTRSIAGHGVASRPPPGDPPPRWLLYCSLLI